MKRYPDETEQARRPSPAEQVEGLALFEPPPEDTRRSAQEAIQPRIARLEELVLAELTRGGRGTADQLAERLGEDRLSIRPRCTALHQRGLIYDTGARAPNDSGRNAIIWGKK